MFLLAAACSGEPDASRTSGIDESKPPLKPDGPLLGFALVAEASEDGHFTDPQLTFTTGDTEATTVVGLGTDVPEDASLTVAWYRFTGVGGRKHLFSHEIPVGPGGLAFSQAVADGGLAPGTYETVATLDDHQMRTPWFVREGTEPGVAGGGGAGPMALVFQASAQESPDEPSAGDSGYIPDGLGDGPVTYVPPPVAPDSCTITGIDTGIFGFLFSASADWGGPCPPVTLAATVSGPLQTLRTIDLVSGTGFGSTNTNADNDTCRLPGGSDLPGTVVRVVATGSGGAMRADTITLPDSEALGVGFELTNPAAGSMVEADDPIVLEAVAVRMPPTFGIESLKLYADGELFHSVGNLSGTEEPIPCDNGKNAAYVRTQYTVPADPPAIIEICAEAVGFDGTKARECIEFYTGEVWKGTVTGPSVEHSAPCTYQHDGAVTIVVAEDGMATLDANLSASGGCRGVSAIGEAPFTLTGRRTSTGFAFSAPFTGMGPLTIATTGNHGSGTSTGFVGPTYEVTLEFTVDCETCG